jgi:hypothetical protein
MYTHALTRATIHMVASLALASPRLASHRSPPRLTRLATHALASLSLAYSPRIARIARIASLGLTSRLASHRSIASHRLSLASPRSPSHRLARRHLASTATGANRLVRLASPCSPRLDARLASLALPRLSRLASPLSPCLASFALPRLARLASPLARSPRLASALAFLARLACSLASATAPLATSASRCLQRCLQNLRDTHAARLNRRTRFSGGMATPSLNWGSID